MRTASNTSTFMTHLLIGLLLFLGIHSLGIVSPTGRERLVARLGEGAWKGLYSLVSLLGFVLLIYGYGVARQHPVLLYAPPVWARHLTALLMLAPFPLLFAAYLPGRIKKRLKHPMLLAVVVWATAHLIANGTLADLLLFGGFGLWALASIISLQSRPNRPLRTIAARPLNDGIAISLGLIAYLSFVLWLHARLIGVSPLPM
jgi:uncharacterized membrane protein